VDDLSEKEQLDLMRAWWKENGNFVIAGALLGIVLLVGWNQWRGSVVGAQLNGSALFESIMNNVADGDLEQAEAKLEQLETDFAKSTYPGHASLAMARLYMDKGRDQDAAEVLQRVLDSDAGETLKNIARLRLAKVWLYQDKAEDVIAILSEQMSGGFTARYSEVLGDAHAALGQYDDAAEAYAVALADNPRAPTVDITLVQMKINDLPEEGAPAAIDESLQTSAEEADASAESDAAVPGEQEGEGTE